MGSLSRNARECHEAPEFNGIARGRFDVLFPGSFRSSFGNLRKSTMSKALCRKSAIVAGSHRGTSKTQGGVLWKR